MRSNAARARALDDNRSGLPEAVQRAIEAAPMGPPDTDAEARSVAAARSADIWVDHETMHAIVDEFAGC